MNAPDSGPLQPGTKAPEFEVRDQAGESVSLRSFRGRKVVLYFYPRDSTPTCTVQACAFRDRWSAIEELGAVVLGVSTDGEKSHRKFSDRHDLPFRLLADEGHQLAQAYGVWGPKKLFGIAYEGINRTTFVLDEVGVISHVFEKVKVRGHVDAVLEALRS